MAAKIGTHWQCGEDTYVVSENSGVTDSISRADAEAAAAETVEAETEEGDAPVLFMCAKCRRPVGDSLSWAGSDDKQNQIMLNRVTDHVVIGKEHFVSGSHKELGCLVVNLTCNGCSSLLGFMYTSTPKMMDYKRSLFCFGVENIESYVYGAPDQKEAALDKEEKPVTLEYRENIEQQMTKIKSLAVTIGQRLLEIERWRSDLQCKSGN